MKKKLNKVAKDTNLFLKKFIFNQKKTDLLNPIKYGLLPGGKKIRSKLIVDVGRIFNTEYKKLIQISAAVECIHAYSLIHDDLPCMDNDRLRRGKLSTHAKFGESTAILAGNSLLTIAFEILSQSTLKIDYKSKINLISLHRNQRFLKQRQFQLCLKIKGLKNIKNGRRKILIEIWKSF